MENIVRLSFKKTSTNLAGYDYGIEVYEEQVRGKIDVQAPFIIEFPQEIKGIASSFVQGFFADIVGEIGLIATEERATVKAGSERLEKSVISKLQ